LVEYEYQRARQVEELIVKNEERLADHKAGRRILKEDQHSLILMQLQGYYGILEDLASEGEDEKMERALEEKEAHRELLMRSNDIDWTKTGI
jgi:hypothetical protein